MSIAFGTVLRLLLCVLLAITLTACDAAVAQAQGCTMDFEASVRQGPDAGILLVGNLSFKIDGNGRLSGALVTKDGRQIAASGQTVGQAISLIFNLDTDQHIFGTGTLEHDVQECSGVMGGSLTGPNAGDSGDWLGKAQEQHRQ